MDIYDIRQQNLQDILDDYFDGSVSALARAITKVQGKESKPAYIYRHFYEGANRKVIGDDRASLYEKAVGLSKGSLDVPSSGQVFDHLHERYSASILRLLPVIIENHGDNLMAIKPRVIAEELLEAMKRDQKVKLRKTS